MVCAIPLSASGNFCRRVWWSSSKCFVQWNLCASSEYLWEPSIVPAPRGLAGSARHTETSPGPEGSLGERSPRPLLGLNRPGGHLLNFCCVFVKEKKLLGMRMSARVYSHTS